jgi:hypothetical protein
MAGFCAGAEQPGYMNPFPGRGRRLGRRHFGWQDAPRWGQFQGAGRMPLEQRLDRLQAELADLRQIIGEAEYPKPEG